MNRKGVEALSCRQCFIFIFTDLLQKICLLTFFVRVAFYRILWYYVENYGGGDKMLCNRLKQFREYNGLVAENLAQILEISTEQYKAFESGKDTPTIDIIEKLAECYKVTIDEFYGYTLRLEVYDKSIEPFDEDVDEKILKMADLSWDEVQLILHYRSLEDKEDLIKKIIKKNTENKKK